MMRKWTAWGLTGLWVVLTGACHPVSDAWLTGWTETEAKDQIMLVRKEPSSLGLRRLTNQAGVYPDLGGFLHAHGMPDFLAESNAGNRHFLILYYLDANRAYSCRTLAPETREIEFSGPYPMTRREHHLLRGLKKVAAGMPAATPPMGSGKPSGSSNR
ncbi:MAG: hypothetical protein WCP45_13795 [Verrucomicrobiota bacterium]